MFIAPEVLHAQKDKEYGAPVDIWSLGCTVIAMLGRDPWESEEQLDMQLLWKIAFSRSMPTGVPKNCPAMLRDFFGRCFDRDATKRWTAAQLLEHEWITCPDNALEPVPPREGGRR
eukprot:gene7725-biopygen4840